MESERAIRNAAQVTGFEMISLIEVNDKHVSAETLT